MHQANAMTFDDAADNIPYYSIQPMIASASSNNVVALFITIMRPVNTKGASCQSMLEVLARKMHPADKYSHRNFRTIGTIHSASRALLL